MMQYIGSCVFSVFTPRCWQCDHQHCTRWTCLVYVCFQKIGMPQNNGKPYSNGWFGGTAFVGNTHLCGESLRISYVYTDSLCTLASWAGGILNVYPCMHRNPTDPEKTNDAYLHICISVSSLLCQCINCIDVQHITKSYMPSFSNLGTKTQVIWSKKSGPNGKSPDSTHANYNHLLLIQKSFKSQSLLCHTSEITECGDGNWYGWFCWISIGSIHHILMISRRFPGSWKLGEQRFCIITRAIASSHSFFALGLFKERSIWAEKHPVKMNSWFT